MKYTTYMNCQLVSYLFEFPDELYDLLLCLYKKGLSYLLKMVCNYHFFGRTEAFFDIKWSFLDLYITS